MSRDSILFALTVLFMALLGCSTRGRLVGEGPSLAMDFGAQQPRVPLTRRADGRITARLGGRDIDAELLDRGRREYLVHCSACHGFRGDGRGESALGMRPRPRDFTRGRFKFAGDASGALPTDGELRRIVREGLGGTAMQPWPVADGDLRAIVQYLKTLSPRWRREAQPAEGSELNAPNDPWGETPSEQARARGERVYHGLAQCVACHPGYVSRERIREYTRELTGVTLEPRPEFWLGRVVHEDGYGDDAPATDFKRQTLRAGTTPSALYRTISAGIDGTPMPSWRGALSDRDLWALAHYVHELIPGTTALSR